MDQTTKAAYDYATHKTKFRKDILKENLCPCWNSHNDSCYDDNCSCDRYCEYMKSFNSKKD